MTSRSVVAVVATAGTLLATLGSGLASGAPATDRPADKTTPTVPTTDPGTATSAPTTAGPTTTTTTTSGGPSIGAVVNVGDAKPERFYDEYLARALADIDAWWSEHYPRLYGEPWAPLAGGVYAGYPERSDPIPGCGFPGDTSYQDINDFGAFYCPDGDYMAYDDGELGVIYELAERFSPSIVAVVLAHEYGHAIQFRTGDLDRNVPTVFTEQQADCISGAWARHVWDGEVPGLSFSDEDIRTGLISLTAVRDPIGIDVLEPGGHGSAFDRIGAFQHGFIGGIDNCVALVDAPLPLVPNEFTGNNDESQMGDAPYGWGDGPPPEILYLVGTDLRLYWPEALAEHDITMPAVTLRPTADPRTDHCGDPAEMRMTGAVFCAASNEVVFDEALGRELYDDFGDFSVGYVIGHAWADGVQDALGSQLQGEPHALASDCLVGAWVASAMDKFDPGGGPTLVVIPGGRMQVSPGDLDEAVQTMLVVGDRTLAENVEGSAFEKFAAVRRGVISGLPSCLADVDNVDHG